MGYNKQCKACRLYNPITKKIIRRDVKFQEDKSWDNQTSEIIFEQIPSIHEDKKVESIGHQPSPRLQVLVQGEQTKHNSSSSSSNDLDPTITNLRNQKTRRLR